VGSSFVSIGERGFWARDGDIDVFLVLMRERFGADPALDLPEGVREVWQVQARIGAFSGCAYLGLDELSTAQRWTLHRLVALLAREVDERPDAFAAARLNALAPESGTFTRDYPRERFARFCACAQRLLADELTWTAGDPEALDALEGP
jgi:hypothetical protein